MPNFGRYSGIIINSKPDAKVLNAKIKVIVKPQRASDIFNITDIMAQEGGTLSNHVEHVCEVNRKGL